MADTPKIYVFINGRWGSDYAAIAVAQDGTVVASHVSSSVSWAQRDMGVTGDWKHDKYAEHYPDGYAVEWVDDPLEHAGVKAAFELNQAMEEVADGA